MLSLGQFGGGSGVPSVPTVNSGGGAPAQTFAGGGGNNNNDNGSSGVATGGFMQTHQEAANSAAGSGGSYTGSMLQTHQEAAASAPSIAPYTQETGPNPDAGNRQSGSVVTDGQPTADPGGDPNYPVAKKIPKKAKFE